MPKSKQQKKKDREKRVSQEKHAAAEKRAQIKTTEAVQQMNSNINKPLMGSLAPPKMEVTKGKQTHIRPRNVGSP